MKLDDFAMISADVVPLITNWPTEKKCEISSFIDMRKKKVRNQEYTSKLQLGSEIHDTQKAAQNVRVCVALK